MEIVITDEGILKAKIASFSKDGRNSIHVLTDFDKTLTKFVLPNGEEMPSLIFRIRNGFYLSKEYSQKANELYYYFFKCWRFNRVFFKKRRTSEQKCAYYCQLFKL